MDSGPLPEIIIIEETTNLTGTIINIPYTVPAK